jgi:hypothetical protein
MIFGPSNPGVASISAISRRTAANSGDEFGAVVIVSPPHPSIRHNIPDGRTVSARLGRP